MTGGGVGRRVEEAEETCVRDDVCDIVRLSWRVMNGECDIE